MLSLSLVLHKLRCSLPILQQHSNQSSNQTNVYLSGNSKSTAGSHVVKCPGLIRHLIYNIWVPHSKVGQEVVC
uniref:Uncharacterized protein n=1 Tax=Anguilla anguilla TaxID=7936 RepID=A0A0E9RPM6_ANGAN